jgi:hypothetical protein
MESATFRKWLAEHGCGFDPHQEKRGTGQVNVTVHREGRKAEVPLGGSRQILDARIIRCACEELGVRLVRIGGTAEPGVSREREHTIDGDPLLALRDGFVRPLDTQPTASDRIVWDRYQPDASAFSKQ